MGTQKHNDNDDDATGENKISIIVVTSIFKGQVLLQFINPVVESS